MSDFCGSNETLGKQNLGPAELLCCGEGLFVVSVFFIAGVHCSNFNCNVAIWCAVFSEYFWHALLCHNV